MENAANRPYGKSSVCVVRNKKKHGKKHCFSKDFAKIGNSTGIEISVIIATLLR
jgi:hypothetical protein